MADERDLSDPSIERLFGASPPFADSERFAAQVQRAAAAQARLRRLTLIAAGAVGGLIAFVAITMSGVLAALPALLAPLREAAGFAAGDAGALVMVAAGAVVALTSLSWRYLFR